MMLRKIIYITTTVTQTADLFVRGEAMKVTLLVCMEWFWKCDGIIAYQLGLMVEMHLPKKSVSLQMPSEKAWYRDDGTGS